jgi:hypothetical protein
VFLILAFGDSNQPAFDHIEYQSAEEAQQALDTLRTSEAPDIEFRNKRGDVLAVRRSTIIEAWTSDVLPQESHSLISVAELIARLGPPVYDGPTGFGWRQVYGFPMSAPVTSDSSGRLLMWSCSASGDTCMAEIKEADLAVFSPCRLHQ